jgi:hypothetical protein
MIMNVENIMEEIRREIELKGYRNESIAFLDVPTRVEAGAVAHPYTLEGRLSVLKDNHSVTACRKLQTGPVKMFVKKIIRKLVKFYVEPIVVDQNNVNGLVTSCLQDMYLDMTALQYKYKQLEEENNELKKKLEELLAKEIHQ